MADRTHEQLLGYLVNALEDVERVALEARLAREPALRQLLAQAEERLEPLRSAKQVYGPPPGLAERTCRMVFAYAEALATRPLQVQTVSRPRGRGVRAMSPAAAPPSSVASWGWGDLLVAVGVFLAVACLIFPAIQLSRMNMRLVCCQNNLRDMGVRHAQLQQAFDGAWEGSGWGARPGRMGLPIGSLLRSGVLNDRNPPRSAGQARPPERIGPGSAPSLVQPFWSAHQGFSHTVIGQNLLFLDGHVSFWAIGPVWEPVGNAPLSGPAVPARWPPATPDSSSLDPVPPVVWIGVSQP